MKPNYIKGGICMAAMLLTTLAANAQVKTSRKTAYNGGRYDSYDVTRNEQGKHIEEIQMMWDDKTYKMELVNNKMTALYIDGEKIPASDWDKYGDAIKEIRKQIKRNKEQAIRNQVQAKKNQEQAGRNQEQAERNQEQARRNQAQDKKNEAQAERNQQQARLNQIQEGKNQQQAVRNQEQARLNEAQAKKNQEEAEENQRVMKQLIDDLVADKIIPDENSLHDLKLNSDEMIINGTKQPDEVFKKYSKKYERFSRGDFSYRN
jgi:colicin import membrane protein